MESRDAGADGRNRKGAPEDRRRGGASMIRGITSKITVSNDSRWESTLCLTRSQGRSPKRTPTRSTDERERLKALERENQELHRANQILRKASAFFAQAELDRSLK
jgi:transposase-like protein